MLFTLFLTFAKIGLFTFGGGYAMISLIEHVCVEEKGWITHDDMMDITVIAESTPGPVAINCSTYVGYKQKGFMGAVAATFGMVLPSFVIIYLISMWLNNLLEIRLIGSAFQGIRIAVGFLILDAGLRMGRKMKKKPTPLAIMLGSGAVMLLINLFSLRISSVTLILLAGTAGLFLSFLVGRPAGRGGEKG